MSDENIEAVVITDDDSWSDADIDAARDLTIVPDIPAGEGLSSETPVNDVDEAEADKQSAEVDAEEGVTE